MSWLLNEIFECLKEKIVEPLEWKEGSPKEYTLTVSHKGGSLACIILYSENENDWSPRYSARLILYEYRHRPTKLLQRVIGIFEEMLTMDYASEFICRALKGEGYVARDDGTMVSVEGTVVFDGEDFPAPVSEYTENALKAINIYRRNK
jgi:hypothetical protein